MTDREKQLIMDRQKAEEEFGKMRAKFKDLYLKKEGNPRYIPDLQYDLQNSLSMSDMDLVSPFRALLLAE